ncbi:MAG: TIGR03013 family PEP-CTERM/XrtA system glycosyltransferase [Chromatiales bacterium]
MPIRIFNHYVHLPIVILAVVEGLICFGSVYGAAFLRFSNRYPGLWDSKGALFAQAVVFALTMLGALVAVGLYHARQRAGTIGVLVRVIAGVALGLVGITLIFYIFPVLYFGRGFFAYAAFLSILGILLARIVFSNVVDEEIFKRRVLVYGAGQRAESLTMLRRRTDQRGFKLLGFVRCEGDADIVPANRLVHLTIPIHEFAEAASIDEVVVAMDDRRQNFPLHDLLECRVKGIDVLDLMNFLERETGKVKLDVMNPSWIIFSEGFNRNALREFVRRAFDLVASAGLLAIAWPLMIVAAVAIKFEDGIRAPVFYRQRRVGLDGEVFNLLKFRSMSVNAEADGKAQWAQKNDSRVTRVGGIMRKTRIDELPQLLNVLRGDMSFVGPRPERPEFVSQLNERIPYYRERHCVKPGITGWAQLCYPYGSSEKDALEKLQYDLYYVKNHGFLFDLMILLQTAEVVLWGKGAR